MDTSIEEGQELGRDREEARGDDRLRRVIHAALILYLSPAILLVFVTGAVMIAVLGVFKGVVWVASRIITPRWRGVGANTASRAYQGLTTAPSFRGGRFSRSAGSGVLRTSRSGNEDAHS